MRPCRWPADLACAIAALALIARALAQPLAFAGDMQELLLGVEINGKRVAQSALVLRSEARGFWLTGSQWRAFRLRRPVGEANNDADERWYALHSITGVTTRYDAVRQRLYIDAPPSAFESASNGLAERAKPVPTEPTSDTFLNYAFNSMRAGDASIYAGQLEGGVFGRKGVIGAGLLAQHSQSERGAVRLDTTYTRDSSDRLEPLRIGDTVTQTGAWGRPVRIAGVQWGTHFALQPGYVYIPTSTARGETALPSMVDVFVNNALVARQGFPAGAFSTTSIPTVNRSGDVQLVVRDLLGREVTITQPFQGANELLAPGVAQYGVELGAKRENYGIESFDYGDPIASALYRRGFERVTAEVRGEASDTLVAIGAALDTLFPGIGVVNGTLAVSDAKDAGGGWLAGAAFSRQWRDASFTARGRWTSDGWHQAGTSELFPVPKRELAVSAGVSLGRAGAVNVAFIEQRYPEREKNQFATTGWTLPLLHGATLALSALYNLVERSNIFSLFVTVPLGARERASIGEFVRRGDASDRQYTPPGLQRNLPLGEGLDYRVLARSRTDVRAGTVLAPESATSGAELTRFDGTEGLRLPAAGGVGMIGNFAFACHEIAASLALARVEDYDDGGVTLDNRPSAPISRGGYAVLPRLTRPHDIDRVGMRAE